MRLIGLAALVFVAAVTYALSAGEPITHAHQLTQAGHSTQPSTHDGQAIFRYDTFGDEQLWTDTLRMHEVIATVDPATALAVGLKVDVDALPEAVVAALRAGRVNLKNPAVTIELLRLNAVVGVKGDINADGPTHGGGDHLRTMPFVSGRFIRAKHRQASGRMGQCAIWTSARSSRCRQRSTN